jgi:hypothetical protein
MITLNNIAVGNGRGNGFSGFYSQDQVYTVPSTHFSIYKDTFSFYKDRKCVINTLILMPEL